MSSPFFQVTRGVFLWTRLLNVPFWAIFSLLPFILYKDLQATTWQITLIVAIKPLSGCFSFYWGAFLKDRRDRLRSNLIAANLLKYLPFLAFPWIDNVWWFIAAYACYMTLMRGGIPGWIEIIKLNISGKQRDSTFAAGSVIDFTGGAFLPLLLGLLLDDYPEAWRWIFFATACLGILSTLLLYRLPTAHFPPSQVQVTENLWSQTCLQPLRDVYRLLQQYPDFARFQIGFMLGGTGLILIQPALSSFFIDTLAISYVEIAAALTICKGIGFAVTTPLWVKAFHRIDLFLFCSAVTLVATLFPLFLLAAPWHLGWLYAAYLLYGAMQGGSELSWHMSAPLFSREGDSSLFTSTAILAAGIRGCIVPALGGLLFATTGTTVTLLCASVCSLLATYVAWRFSFHATVLPLYRIPSTVALTEDSS